MARASVRVRVDDFEDGVLPGVCASTGAPADHLFKTDISSRLPVWVFLLVFGGPIGVVAALVLSFVLRKTVHGAIPYTDAVQAKLQERVRTYAWFAVSSFGLCVGGLALIQVEAFRPLGIVVILGSIVIGAFFVFLWSNPPGSVGGHLDSTGRWIELDPVSTAFAAAYGRQEAARTSQRRNDAYERR